MNAFIIYERVIEIIRGRVSDFCGGRRGMVKDLVKVYEVFFS